MRPPTPTTNDKREALLQEQLTRREGGGVDDTVSNLVRLLSQRSAWQGILGMQTYERMGENDQLYDVTLPSFLKKPPFEDDYAEAAASYPAPIEKLDRARVVVWLARHERLATSPKRVGQAMRIVAMAQGKKALGQGTRA